MTLKVKGKSYKVESTSYFGAVINVNGTSITDCDMMAVITDDENHTPDGSFTVFCDSDELWFPNFAEAYEFAMTKQKDTFRLE